MKIQVFPLCNTEYTNKMKKITILIIGAILSMGCTVEKDNGLVDFVVDYRLVESKGSVVELGFPEFTEGTVKD